MKIGWVAKIVAKKGTVLLGGVPVHVSSPFAAQELAEQFKETVIQTNIQAGREVDLEKSKVNPINVKNSTKLIE